MIKKKRSIFFSFSTSIKGRMFFYFVFSMDILVRLTCSAFSNVVLDFNDVVGFDILDCFGEISFSNLIMKKKFVFDKKH